MHEECEVEVPTDTSTEFELGDTAAYIQKSREEREQREGGVIELKCSLGIFDYSLYYIFLYKLYGHRDRRI